MDGYCLRTRLLEKQSVCLYYKGMEVENPVCSALNTIVAFTSADALELDENTARSLCKRLNEDKDSLLECGFSEFETIKKANGV